MVFSWLRLILCTNWIFNNFYWWSWCHRLNIRTLWWHIAHFQQKLIKERVLFFMVCVCALCTWVRACVCYDVCVEVRGQSQVLILAFYLVWERVSCIHQANWPMSFSPINQPLLCWHRSPGLQTCIIKLHFSCTHICQVNSLLLNHLPKQSSCFMGSLDIVLQKAFK